MGSCISNASIDISYIFLRSNSYFVSSISSTFKQDKLDKYHYLRQNV